MGELFHDVVFGPINSRRFGVSLGINTLPLDNKICNFNCIYCECGWTDLKSVSAKFLKKEAVITAIENKFKELSEKKIEIDAITFAGNGEPSMHPDFLEIIKSAKLLRDSYFPKTKIVVLSNSSLIGNEKTIEALNYADMRVMKLDAGTSNMFRLIDQPSSSKDINWYIDKLCAFNGTIHIQTLFLKGKYNNEIVDNTTAIEVEAWINALKKIKPIGVMIYTIDRETPAQELQKIEKNKLMQIRDKVIAAGIKAEVY